MTILKRSKELSTLWPSIHSNLYNLIHAKQGRGAWEHIQGKLFRDFLHFDCIAFLSSGGKILISKVMISPDKLFPLSENP